MTPTPRLPRNGESSKPLWDNPVVKVIFLLGLVYLFILAITMLGASFKLAGRGLAESILHATANPVMGLIIGILTTSIVQSSSTTTSLVVALVGAGTLPFQAAIPMIMGANIGTTITNIIVSLGHISRPDEFRRAFAGSIVHDFFNLCSVALLFPLQIEFDLIGRSAQALEKVFEGFGGARFGSPLEVIAKPVSSGIISHVGDCVNAVASAVVTPWMVFLKGHVAASCIVVALLLLFLALRYIVVVLRSLVLSRVERFFQRYVFRTASLSFILGIVITALVQSSSITTSLVVPLLGAGVLTLHQIFPYMLGANIGTTVTAFLASFVIGKPEAISVAFAHFMFNVYGTAIFWPLKRIPIFLAEKLSEFTLKSRVVPLAYIAIVFFVLPGLLMLIMGND